VSVEVGRLNKKWEEIADITVLPEGLNRGTRFSDVKEKHVDSLALAERY